MLTRLGFIANGTCPVLECVLSHTREHVHRGHFVVGDIVPRSVPTKRRTVRGEQAFYVALHSPCCNLPMWRKRDVIVAAAEQAETLDMPCRSGARGCGRNWRVKVTGLLAPDVDVNLNWLA